MLLHMTQRLALTRYFHHEVTLSALHDNTSAWLGIGTAFTALVGQRRVRTAPLEVFFILLYLACIFGLGVTTPGLLHVSVGVEDNDVLTSLTKQLPNIRRDE